MGPDTNTIWQRVIDWLAMRPVYLAYRLVWLAARTGHPDARSVYRAMWDCQLDMPDLPHTAPPSHQTDNSA